MVQEQWFNLHLLSNIKLSYYSYLYYLSGLLFPFIVVFYSYSKFINYKFKQDNNNNNYYIKNLFLILLIVLLALSTLLTLYTSNIFYILSNQISINFINIRPLIISISIYSILLLFNKTKKLIKQLVLFTFLIFSIINWTNYYITKIQLEEIFTFLSLEDNFIGNIKFEYLNIVFIILIEIIFYIWSYISYKNNLSNWMVKSPSIQDYYPMIEIIMFYSGIFIYYLIFNNITI